MCMQIPTWSCVRSLTHMRVRSDLELVGTGRNVAPRDIAVHDVQTTRLVPCIRPLCHIWQPRSQDTAQTNEPLCDLHGHNGITISPVLFLPHRQSFFLQLILYNNSPIPSPYMFIFTAFSGQSKVNQLCAQIPETCRAHASVHVHWR